MNSKSSKLVVAGATGLVIISGVTYSLMQGQKSPAPTPIVQESPVPPTSSVASAPASPPSTPQNSPFIPSQPDSETKREIESCVVNMAQVSDPEAPLNVRSGPSTTGEVVGQLRNGTFVTVVGEENGWLQITTPMKGWISKQRTESGCNQKVERVQFGAGESAITISDRFIGTGSHQYLLQVNQGQRMTISSQNGPFPTVADPEGKVVLEGPENENRSTWTTETTQSGNYTITLESNYRGYKYRFRVEVQ